MIDRDILIYILTGAIVTFGLLADCLWASLKRGEGWRS